MDKVYVITAGEYSAYHIVGVMTDKIKAQEYCDRYNTGHLYSSAGIEEYELDEVYNRKYLYKTYICRDHKNKVVQRTMYLESSKDLPDKDYTSGIFPTNNEHEKIALGYADTAEKSQKIAQDYWAQLQAEESEL
jgi:hypothetical protein